MAGILDPKSRFLDVFITDEGRRQLAQGGFDVRYYSFTDVGTSYQGDLTSGSVDSGGKIYFEGCNLPQDSITLEANDSGNVVKAPILADIFIKDGGFYQARRSGTTSRFLSVTGSAFASTSESLFSGFLQNFQNNQIIGSNDSIFDDSNFSSSPSIVNFSIPANTQSSIIIDSSDSFWKDVKVSHLRNFSYLPPLNIDGGQLGNYTVETPLLNYDIVNITQELKGCGKSVIRFNPTSRKNNIALQFFESSTNKLKKLDVIDYGLHQLNGDVVKVAFIGKIYFDSSNDPKFINLFTAIFKP